MLIYGDNNGSLDFEGVSRLLPFYYQGGADNVVGGGQVEQKGLVGIRRDEHQSRGQETL